MNGMEINGSDIHESYRGAKEAIDRARNGGGPTLIEFKTDRVLGHHEGDPGTEYRTKEEVESWKRRCPIKSLRERALETQLADPASFERIHRETEAWLNDAVEFARNSPAPEPASVFNHV